ncbi:glutamate 5-kinase [Hydromonas duriensis]|uniref:Glutamate 5-kinase n=1 Tax=Hydromonas duriensis TaxID=1527608 RepID=A0A4R6YBN8_9BURK|nr:glutamate 5-kinase [Hydromonas duriensis]
MEWNLPADLASASVIKSAKRVVVKVGSSLVTNEGRGLDEQAIASWATQIACLRALGKEVVLVSSGAIAEGMKRLGWSKRPTHIDELQAAAAVGQMGLAQVYETQFAKHQLTTAQILLTHADLADRARYLNARSAMFTLLRLGVIPIINENDTVVTDEIKVGDNDTLGALVANLIEADVLVILTDQAGLYTADPRKHSDAQLIQTAPAGLLQLEQMAGGAGSNIGTGGMLTKVLAAKRAMKSGAHTVIASGRELNVLPRLAEGERIGTELKAQVALLTARQQWLADHLQLRGRVVLDAGAVRAVQDAGKSVLPIGVLRVEGLFDRGDVVACVDEQGLEIARGLVNYSSGDAMRIARHASDTFGDLLGRDADEAELIHRNNLVRV